MLRHLNLEPKTIKRMIAAEFLGFCGAGLCGLVGVQMFTSVADSLQRYSARRTRFRLRNDALRSELKRLSRISTTIESRHAWEGWRKFRVQEVIQEINGCHSIYMVPHDGKPLPTYRPGQYLTFSVRCADQRKPAVRCYSLSDAPNSDYYRCTVKKVPPSSPDLPSGVVSTHFNEVIQEGDLLDVKSPRGGFFLDMTREDPIVLLAGGVGITPLLSMVNTIVATESRRVVHLFCGFRNSDEHLFKEHLATIAENHQNIHVHTAYSAPKPDDSLGTDYDVEGYISLDILREKLPSNNFEYFLCGPGPFMNSLSAVLKEWGVPSEAIHSEAFGPASVAKPQKSVSQGNSDDATPTASVTFARSGVNVAWDPECDTILDLAEQHNVPIDSGCRAGNCGTCAIAVKRGTVNYTQEPSAEVEDGSCLACIATPESDIELDA